MATDKELKKIPTRDLRDRLEDLMELTSRYENEAENIIDEIKRRGLKI